MLNEVRAHFRPEFLNRLDDIIVFEPLTQDQITHIVDLQLAAVKKLLEAKNLSMVVDAKVKELLASRGYDPVYGARPLKRLVADVILNPLANRLLVGDFNPGDAIKVSVEKGEIAFHKA